jgi:hypothetical protein
MYLGGNGAWAHDGSSFPSKVHGSISAVYEPQRSHSAVFWHGADDYVHYMYLGGNGAWAHDGSSLTSEKVVGDIASAFSVAENHSVVAFCGASGYIQMYHVPSGSWQLESNFSKNQKVNGRISLCYATQRKHIEIFTENNSTGSYYYHNGSTLTVDDSTMKH